MVVNLFFAFNRNDRGGGEQFGMCQDYKSYSFAFISLIIRITSVRERMCTLTGHKHIAK